MSLVRVSRLELRRRKAAHSLPRVGAIDVTTVLLKQRDVVHMGASVKCLLRKKYPKHL